ncbi:MAG: prolipoprotein diacylglyceryl transferase, partial [Candidatus Latescibacteria bacterium]|nr:prolipoprotein diacylglyceryl transferase [Candidatus Latescibacterota bacterium]
MLLKIGSFELRSWGVAFAISVLVGIGVAVKRAPRFGVKPSTIMDLAVVIMIAAIVGSRLWYVVYHINEFKGHWFDIVNPFQDGHIGIAGLSMIGGVVLAILASLVYAWMKKWSFVALGDAIAPSFLLGAGIQRLGGCFLNGCCFGKPTDLPWAVSFPYNSFAYLSQINPNLERNRPEAQLILPQDEYISFIDKDGHWHPKQYEYLTDQQKIE